MAALLIGAALCYRLAKAHRLDVKSWSDMPSLMYVALGLVASGAISMLTRRDTLVDTQKRAVSIRWVLVVPFASTTLPLTDFQSVSIRRQIGWDDFYRFRPFYSIQLHQDAGGKAEIAAHMASYDVAREWAEKLAKLSWLDIHEEVSCVSTRMDDGQMRLGTGPTPRMVLLGLAAACLGALLAVVALRANLRGVLSTYLAAAFGILGVLVGMLPLAYRRVVVCDRDRGLITLVYRLFLPFGISTQRLDEFCCVRIAQNQDTGGASDSEYGVELFRKDAEGTQLGHSQDRIGALKLAEEVAGFLGLQVTERQAIGG